MDDIDFGDLKDDKEIQVKIQNFHDSINNIEKLLSLALNSEIYDKLTTKEKVDYDLFIAYTLNTLYWLYLRSKGEEPNNNDVRNQLLRVREYMLKAKQAHERNTIRPRVDAKVAGRFVKHGINYKQKESKGPPNKKIKFTD